MAFLTEDDLVKYLRKLGLANALGQLAAKAVAVVDAKATGAITALESGTVFRCAVDAVITLPAVTVAADMKGVWYTFICGAVSAGTGLSISPSAADSIGGMGLTSVVNKDLVNTGATDTLTDRVTIECSGIPGIGAWKIVDVQGIFAKEA